MSNKFIFKRYSKNLKSGLFFFNYRLEAGKRAFDFEEILKLPADNIRSDIPVWALDFCLFSLQLILGISYWKLLCPKNIIIKNNYLSKTDAEFWNTVYTKGLGEFFYKNKIDFRGLVNFQAGKGFSRTQKPLSQKGSLLGIGGGKDTIVAAESLARKNIGFEGFIVETQKNYVLNRELSEMFHSKILHIKRILDPKLFILNKEKGFYNGHIPISAVYGFIGVLCSLLYGYKNIIVSNERSADAGNVSYLGQEINHQWSKSWEFENLLNSYLKRNLSEEIKYFSILRPYSELKILSEFAKMKKFHSYFSSCNKNYAIHAELSDNKWCGRCPKCAFVFIGLSAFLPEFEVISIFRTNMLESEKNLDKYKKLLGILDHKPFECVGTADETKAAFLLAHKRLNFSKTPVMQYFINEVLSEIQDPEGLTQEVLKSDFTGSAIPSEFNNII